MIILIIFGIVGAIIGFVANRYEFIFRILSMILGIFVAGTIAALLCLFLSMIPGTPTVERTDIVALADNISMEGNFFLGSGTIEGELYYYYMTEESKGVHQVKKVKNMSELYIYTDGGNYIEITKHHSLLSPWLAFEFAPDILRVEIHIPPNSIIYDYKIDME